MSEITPDLVAQLATRLYQQIPHPPGAVPGTVPVDTQDIARQLLSRARQETAATSVPLPGAGAPGAPPGDDPGLGLVAQAFAAIKASTGQGVPAAAPARSLHPVPGHPASSNLGHHADNLVRQQTYRDSGAGHGSLQGFVSNIQTCNLDPESRARGTGGVADPFRRLFEASLPAQSKLGTAYAPFNVAAIRQDFPILNQQVHGKQLVWFDNAATTQKPRQVIAALDRFYRQDNSNIHRGAHTLAARATDAFEGARDTIRDFLNAGSSEEIVFVRGTTEGINLVAACYGKAFLREGDEILLSELEHHANIVPWQIAARERGAVIKVIPVDDRGEIRLAEYQRLLGPRTRLVGLAHANNSLGTVLPIAEMTHLAKRNGSHVLIDGAQSVAHLPVDVQALGVDFYVFSGHKIFGPTGIGALYGRRELLEALPPWQGGGNMIKDVTFEETSYSDLPAKFEAGTPNVADAYGLGVALDYVRRIGLRNIADYEHRLLEHATEGLRAVNGLRLVGSARQKVAVTSFVLKDKSVPEVGQYLNRQGIAVRSGHHCAQPSLRRFGLEATVRPSFSLYNTFDEIDWLVQVLKQLR
jgi:cysteine desulfurase / selenocysteine lyase